MRSWIGRAVVFSIAIIIAGGIGFYFGARTRGTNIEKQIKCLKMMWGEPLLLLSTSEYVCFKMTLRLLEPTFSIPFEKRVGLLVASSKMP